MIKNIFIVSGIVICLFTNCNREEDRVEAVENMRDWFRIEEKPGEVNRWIYKVYQENGITIFVNDTLGQEERGTDAYGYPVIHTELFDMGYYVYGTYEDARIRLSSDSSAMLAAIGMIKDLVAPWLPAAGEYRPHSFLLVDSVLVSGRISYYDVTYETNLYSRSIKGLVVGRLNRIKEMSADELQWFAGEILAVKCADWIQENCPDELQYFYKVTGDNYNVAYTSSLPAGTLEKIGFIKWLEVSVSSRHLIQTPDQEEDIRHYVAAVYVYRGKEAEFHALYEEYPNVVSKFDRIRPLVESYEKANEIKG